MEWVGLLGILLGLYWVFRTVVAPDRRAVAKGSNARPGSTYPTIGLEVGVTTKTQTTSCPTLPFTCRVESQSRDGVFYTVDVDAKDNWTCTCPDFLRERHRLGRTRYFCKHCIRIATETGLKVPKRWKAKSNGEWLVGELIPAEGGGVRMTVDGFATSRELYEIYNVHPKLVEKHLGSPDEVALFTEGSDIVGGCDLYDQARLRTVMQSPQYLEDRDEINRKLEATRETREKISASLKAHHAARRAREEAEDAERRSSFGGRVWIARCGYTHGWLEYGVYARDADHARTLMRRWLKSDEGKEERERLYDDAICEHEDLMEMYREDRKIGVPASELNRPSRPLKRDFALHIEETIKTSDTDTARFEIEEVQLLREGGGWYKKYNG